MNTATNTVQNVEYWYGSFRDQFVNMGLKLGYRHEEINDIINQFFLGLLEKKLDLSVINNPQAYLSVAFKRKLIDHYRNSRQTQFVDTAMLEDKLAEPSVQETLEQLQSDKELIRKVRIAYKKLPQRCQKVIYLKFYEGLNTEQIAEQTGLTKRTVYNNLFEGVKLLRSELNREYPSVRVAALLSAMSLIFAGELFFDTI